ncbi:MAG: GNAT family N-acetyltransferase [Solirubrobacterales bacterium]|nr:GNAT family N-acetyltransferase [Solirubrobacterales bacterium]
MSVAERLAHVETERLVCERLRSEHASELISLHRDPRVARTLELTGEPPSQAQIFERLSAKIAHWERYGFGLWLLRDRRSGAMVGRGGLQHTFVAGRAEIEVGWAIVPARWGQGLATEMAHAAVAAAFDELALREIVAFTLPHNTASRRVMEKAGFVFERSIIHVGMQHVLYRRHLASLVGKSHQW